MRYVSLPIVLFIVMFVFTSCRKDQEPDETAEGTGSLTGNWELYKSWGGMMPLINYAAGNGNEMHFDGTGYRVTRSGQVVQQGTYHLTRDSILDVNSCALLPPEGMVPNHIVYQNQNNGFKNCFKVTDKTLQIWTGCIPLDGGVSVYKRKADNLLENTDFTF